MESVLASLSFVYPWLLAALPLLLLLPRRRTWGWRLLALALLLVALAQPSIGRPSQDVAVLVDVSDSVGDGAREALAGFDFGTLRQPPMVFYFAGDAALAPAANAPLPPEIDSGRSDLARALQVAAAAGAKRALLLSDGAQSNGDALLALPPFPVDVHPTRSRDNARLSAILTPQKAAPGETVEAVAVVESDRSGRLTLYPTVDGRELEPIERSLPAGRTTVPFTFTVEGSDTVRVGASLDVDYEQPRADDAQTSEVAVSAREPVLVLDDPAMARLLRGQGLEVREGTVADVQEPLDYSAVVLRDGAGAFTPGQLAVFARYVDNGGGLMMTGGPESFGFGAWYRTPVEEVLPVNTDLRTDVRLPLVALVIVMDRSQSMSTGNPSKIELAKEGAISVVDLAYQDDLLGLLVFSDESATEWVFRPRPATERGKQEMLNAILAISTQGGTVLQPAYEQALTTLRSTDAAVKHIIILSDGKLYDGQGPFGGASTVDFNAMAAEGFGADITTSTIAIGLSADFDRLEAIARAGGGRYYQALDVNTLPQIFTGEALTATRSLLREEALRPTLRAHPLTGRSGPLPPLDAYIATTVKADAEILLEGEAGEPVLAVRRQGLGRSAALTTDLNGWAGELGSWSGLPGLLGTVTRWLQARPADYSATVRREGSELHVVVDAVKDGAYVNNRSLTVRFDGEQVALEQVAPGRYEGRLSAAAGGGALLVVDGSEVVARATVSTPSPEFDREGADELLRQIAARSGGQVLTSAGLYAPATPASARPLWPYLALAALTLFLLELVARRFASEAPRRAGRPGRAAD